MNIPNATEGLTPRQCEQARALWEALANAQSEPEEEAARQRLREALYPVQQAIMRAACYYILNKDAKRENPFV